MEEIIKEQEKIYLQGLLDKNLSKKNIEDVSNISMSHKMF